MYSRRTILQHGSLTGAAIAFSGILPGLKATAQTTVPTRHSLGDIGLDDKDLGLWRDFVGYMKAQPSGNSVSWVGFSSIHGTNQGFNLCPHGDWYFLSWHRAYVSMYEQAVRTWSKDDSFAMPYWDWTTDRQIPKAYSDPQYKGKPNPLYDSTRTMSATQSLPDDMVGPEVIRGILSESDFQVFGTSKNPQQTDLDQSWIPRGGGVSGPLESNPHNRVHCQVGGQMCTATSAQDPIFFMHHGNIDRIWALWNQLGGVNTTDSLWTDMPFENNFRKMDGTNYTVISGKTQSTEAMGYQYDLPPAADLTTIAMAPLGGTLKSDYRAILGEGPAPEGLIKAVKQNSRAATALNPLDVSVNVSAAQVTQAIEGSTKAINSLGLWSSASRSPKQIVAVLRDIPPPTANTAEYRIFVNCDYLSLEVPTSDPHYVATFGFFGIAGDHEGHGGGHVAKEPGSYLVNLTVTMQRLARLGRIAGDDVVVQILPVPRQGISPADAAPITPGSVEVAIL
ncbi:tyrosinase family protein [Roseibium suaedae]|uniref:Tyrosinase n=1 Tax=Roseibium suaedae TaxID=735517 RepID=A0A1M7BKJ4_9HYPH|nr:tyrosinase family protein [Roseibium suaedae]SHL55555.1 tyrosinase [Roseibium suaedae]